MLKEKEKNLLFLAFFTFIVIVSIFFLYQNSYAKYRSQSKSGLQLNVASFTILVNDEDIKNKRTLTQQIVPILEENNYVVPDNIAPGSNAYCDIVIDSTKVTVPFTFNLIPSIDEAILPDLKITSYSINPTDSSDKVPLTSTITQELDETVDKTTIRLYVSWVDETGTMTNEEDTKVPLTMDSYPITVKLSFVQLNKK